LKGVAIAVSTVPNRAVTSNPLVLTGTKITVTDATDVADQHWPVPG
jgi:hypothetical protein